MANRWHGLALATLLAALTACGGTTTTGDRPPAPTPSASAPASPSPTPHATPSAQPSRSPSPSRHPSAQPSPTQRSAPVVTKLLVFVVENHSLDEMRGQMPFVSGLARRFGYASHYAAVSHPSLPNYLAMAGGDTFGVTDDAGPASHALHGATVFGQALAHGRTAKVYAEAMPGTCATTEADPYAVKHNAWAYFVDERAACRRYDVPLDALPADVGAGRLPEAGLVVPDLCHDAHDCTLAVADGWLRDQVGRVMSGPDWRSGHLAIVVTADEDDHSQGNLVLTLVAHPSLHGVVVDTPLTHYSLTRMYDEVLGADPLRHAAAAPSMLAAFGLTAAPR